MGYINRLTDHVFQRMQDREPCPIGREIRRRNCRNGKRHNSIRRAFNVDCPRKSLQPIAKRQVAGQVKSVQFLGDVDICDLDGIVSPAFIPRQKGDPAQDLDAAVADVSQRAGFPGGLQEPGPQYLSFWHRLLCAEQRDHVRVIQAISGHANFGITDVWVSAAS